MVSPEGTNPKLEDVAKEQPEIPQIPELPAQPQAVPEEQVPETSAPPQKPQKPVPQEAPEEAPRTPAPQETPEEGQREERETVAVTQAPAEPPAPERVGLNPVWLALLVVLALLAILSVQLFKKKAPGKAPARKPAEPKEREIPGPAEVPQKLSSGIASAVLHDIGRRKDQQDTWSLSDCEAFETRGVMAVVADGMGGLSNGKLVSESLSRIFQEEFLRNADRLDPEDLLLDTASYAHSQITRLLQNSERSGSTLLSAMIRENRLHYLTAGDSHIYLFRNGGMIQLNREHTYREELAVQFVNHKVTLQQVRGDRQAGSLTSFFGSPNLNRLERSRGGIHLLPGDRIVLATDGVFGTLSEEVMEKALALPLDQAVQALDQGIRQADLPYQDNYTALILQYRG